MSDDVEEHWESHVAEYFPQCPLSGSKSLESDVEYGSVQDYIYCLNCPSRFSVESLVCARTRRILSMNLCVHRNSIPNPCRLMPIVPPVLSTAFAEYTIAELAARRKNAPAHY